MALMQRAARSSGVERFRAMATSASAVWRLSVGSFASGPCANSSSESAAASAVESDSSLSNLIKDRHGTQLRIVHRTQRHVAMAVRTAGSGSALQLGEQSVQRGQRSFSCVIVAGHSAAHRRSELSATMSRS